MNVMNVKRISIDNFKGIEHLEVPFGEKGVLIHGDNETGKSTVYDAFCYCLTGKNSEGDTQFEILPIGKTDCSPSVEIEYEMGGVPCTLKRVYACQKDRTGKIKGYSTECYVNGIKKGVKEFEEYITASVAPADVLRLMVDTRYFTEHIPASKGLTRAQKQREMLCNMVEMEPDAEIFSSTKAENPGFEDLEQLLIRFKTVSEAAAFCKARKSEIQQKMVGIPEAIEAYSKQLDRGCVNMSAAELNLKIQDMEREIEKAKETKEASDKEYLVKVKEKMDATIRRSEEAKQKLEDWRSAEQVRRISKANDALRKCEETERKLQKKMTNTTMELSDKKSEIKGEIEKLEAKRTGRKIEVDSLAREYRRLKKEIDKAEGVCPTCGQPMPSEMILKVKAERDEQLKETVTAGKQAKQKLAEIDEQIKGLEKDIEAIVFPKELTDEVLAAKDEVEKAKELYNKAISDKISDDEAPQNIKDELEAATKEACSVLVGNPEADELYEKKANAEKEQQRLEGQLASLKEALIKAQRNEDVQTMIDDLQQEMDKLNKESDDSQRIQDLCKQFENVRAEILEKKANEKFKKVRWKLFEKQKNGEMVPCCIPTFNGKDYDSLSASTKTICNLDIVETFQNYYGCKLPVFVDNAEGITGNIEYDGQLVLLEVSPQGCPKCAGVTGRKQENGTWKCEKCGHEFKKELHQKERKSIED